MTALPANRYDSVLTPRLHYYEQLWLDTFAAEQREKRTAYEMSRKIYRANLEQGNPNPNRAESIIGSTVVPMTHGKKR